MQYFRIFYNCAIRGDLPSNPHNHQRLKESNMTKITYGNLTAYLLMASARFDVGIPGFMVLHTRLHLHYSPLPSISYSTEWLPCHLTKLIFLIPKLISPAIHQQNCHLTFFSEPSKILANAMGGVADAAPCLKMQKQKTKVKWCISCLGKER